MMTLQRLLVGRGCVFFLHRVVRGAERSTIAENRGLEVTPEFLEMLFADLRRRGYTWGTLGDLLAAQSNDAPIAVFTFDDGYRDNLTTALPLFERHGIPFTVYVTTGLASGRIMPWWYVAEAVIAGRRRTGDTFVYEGALCTLAGDDDAQFAAVKDFFVSRPAIDADLVREFAAWGGVVADSVAAELFLSPTDVRMLAAHPLVTIGSHTLSHLSLAHTTADVLLREVCDSKDLLEEWTSREVTHFCYPFGGNGDCGPREAAVVRRAGYRTATTTQMGFVRRRHGDAWLLPRIVVADTPAFCRRLPWILSGVWPPIVRALQCFHKATTSLKSPRHA